MERTTNYKLPQWVESDRIMMEDFNDAMAKIDTGLYQAQGTANTAVQALEKANTAQETANTAVQKADAAQSTADAITAAAYTADHKPYEIGSYTGNGGTKTITLGFAPSFLIVTNGGGRGPSTATIGTWMGTRASMSEITTNGSQFTVVNGTYGSTELWLNYEGCTYTYVAFR